MRVGALFESLRSLVGEDHFRSAPPTEAAIAYRAPSGRGIEPRLDVYLPERRTSDASVVLVHGGGFVIGSREMKPMRLLASRFVEAGISVCSIDYRLIFRGGRLDEAVGDVRAAFEFWRQRAPRYGLDADRISLVGLSAGGTLAMLVAADRGRAVHRLACCFGLYELDHLQGPIASALPRLLFGTSDRGVWSARSPRGVAQPVADTLLLHGTADGLVPVEQARRLAAHRESLGLPTRLVIYPDAPHGFFNAPSSAADLGAEELIRHVG